MKLSQKKLIKIKFGQVSKMRKRQLKNTMNLFKNETKVKFKENEDSEVIDMVVRDFGLNKFIYVEKRYKGLTGNGTPGECHMNVGKLVKRYGGKRVSGYGVYRDHYKGYMRFYFHSVWLNPEGRLIDVTRTNKDHLTGCKEPTLFSIVNVDQPNESLFGPDFSVLDLSITNIDELDLHMDTVTETTRKSLKDIKGQGHQYGVIRNLQYKYLIQDEWKDVDQGYPYEMFKEMVGYWITKDSTEWIKTNQNPTDEDPGGFTYPNGDVWSVNPR